MITYYKVGGCVRDELLGVRSKDIDFAVEAESYEAMRDDILSQGMVIFQERPEFFSIRARHPILGGVDYTLCRKEGFYSDNRHPDNVEVGTIYDDLARRDFTVNAIAKDENGYFIDPHGGSADLANNVLRCVGNTEQRFNEDPLRILRAVRFHIVRGFTLHRDIDNILYSNVEILNKLRTVSTERIYEELQKCFVHDSWGTLQFFRENFYLEKIIFMDGIELRPRVPD